MKKGEVPYTTDMSELRSDPIQVIATYLPEVEMTVADLEWLTVSNPEKVYHINIEPAATVYLDRQFAVRPSRITLRDADAQDSVSELELLFGEQFVENMLQARETAKGYTALLYSLSAENRYAIARKQYSSPLTLPAVRRASANIISAYMQLPREMESLQTTRRSLIVF